MFKKIFTVTVILFSYCVSGEAIRDYYEEPGLHPFGASVSDLNESIDPFSGGLQLSYTDITIPGNGGMDISVHRIYNSPQTWRLPERRVLGAGASWTMHFGRLVVPQGSSLDICSQASFGNVRNNPSIEFPSGGREILARSFDQDYSLISKSLWKAECINGQQGMVVTSPDGTRFTMDFRETLNDNVTWYTSRVDDLFGNWVQIEYRTNAAGVAYIHQVFRSEEGISHPVLQYEYEDIGSGSIRISSITSYPGTSGGETWQYFYEPVNSDGYNFGAYHLNRVVRPDNREWIYAYNDWDGSIGEDSEGNPIYVPTPGAHAIESVTYPTGAVATYEYQYVSFDETKPDHLTTSVHTKTLTGIENSGSQPAVWTYEFAPHSYDMQPSSTNDECILSLDVTTVTSPENITVYRHVGLDYCYAGDNTDPDGPTTAYSYWGANAVGLLKLQETYTHAMSMISQSSNSWRLVQLSDENFDHGAQGLTWRRSKFSKPILVGQYENFDSQATITDDFLSGEVDEDGNLVGRVSYYSAVLFSNFDEYGNPQTKRELINLDSPLDSSNWKETTTTYYNNVDNWIIGRIATETIDTGSSTSEVEVVSNEYYDNGLLESSTKLGVTTRYSYHSNGEIRTITDALNNTTRYESYKRGIPRFEYKPEGISVERGVNNDGTISFEEDASGKRKSFTYDELKRVDGIVFELGLPVDIDYDVGGQNNRIITRGNFRKREDFDGMGQLTRVEVEDTVNNINIITTHRYDAVGKKLFTSYPNSTVGTTFEYDALGRNTRTEHPDGTSSSISYEDYIWRFTDETNRYKEVYYRQIGVGSENETTFIFEGNSDSSQNEISTVMYRNVLGYPLVVRHGSRNSVGEMDVVDREYFYNDHMWLDRKIDPEIGETRFYYDDVGNVSETHYGNSNIVIQEYDDLYRLKTIYFDEESRIDFDYYPNGLTKEKITDTTSWFYQYDDNNNLTNETLVVSDSYYPRSYTFVYGYNEIDNVNEFTYPDGTNLVFSPDAFGRPTQVGSYALDINFHPSGTIANYTLGNGLAVSNQLDDRLRLDTIEVGSLVNLDYEYLPNGNVSSITDLIDANNNVQIGASGYDNVNRLISATGSWGELRYGYSGTGDISNKQLINENSNYFDYEYDKSEKLISYGLNSNGTNNPFSEIFKYDDLGNITYRKKVSYDDLGQESIDIQKYHFDGLSRLVSYENGDSNKIRYAYDASNHLVKKSGQDIFDVEYSAYLSNGNLAFEESIAECSTTVQIYLQGNVVAKKKDYLFSDDADLDTDSDGLSDCREYHAGLNRYDPNDAMADPDGDGISSSDEILMGLNPNSSDSDGDLISDYDELYVHGTSALLSDTDGDGLSDNDELTLHFTNPLSNDSDHDGVSDPDELLVSSNPQDPTDGYLDFDGDGFSNRVESQSGSLVNDESNSPLLDSIQTWSVEFTGTSETSDVVLTRPAIDSSGVVFVASDEGVVYSVYPDGTSNWQIETQLEFEQAPTIDADGNIYLASTTGEVISIDNAGNERWRRQISNEALLGLVIGHHQNVIATNIIGSIFSLATSDGSPQWQDDVGASIEYSPSLGVLSVLFVVDTSGQLHALNSELGGSVWGQPYILQGTPRNSPLIMDDGSIVVPISSSMLETVSQEGSQVSLDTSRPQNGVLDALGGYVEPSLNARLIEPYINTTYTNYIVSANALVVTENRLVFLANESEFFIGEEGRVIRRGAWGFESQNYSSPVLDDDGFVYMTIGNQLVRVTLEGQSTNNGWPMFSRDKYNSNSKCFPYTMNDEDGDQIPDCLEYIRFGLDPLNGEDGSFDSDGDGLTNAQEHALGTDMRIRDTDGDGLTDFEESSVGLDPLSDSDAISDSDGDGFSNRQEILAGTNPADAATSPSNGDVLWSLNGIVGFTTPDLPLVYEGKNIFLSNYSSTLLETELLAVNAAGEKIWGVVHEGSLGNNFIVDAEGNLIAEHYESYSGGSSITSYSPSGQTNWTIHHEAGISSLSHTANGNILVNGCIAYDLSGSHLWTLPAAVDVVSPFFRGVYGASGNYYAVSGRFMYAYDENRNELWRSTMHTNLEPYMVSLDVMENVYLTYRGSEYQQLLVHVFNNKGEYKTTLTGSSPNREVLISNAGLVYVGENIYDANNSWADVESFIDGSVVTLLDNGQLIVENEGAFQVADAIGNVEEVIISGSDFSSYTVSNDGTLFGFDRSNDQFISIASNAFNIGGHPAPAGKTINLWHSNVCSTVDGFFDFNVDSDSDGITNCYEKISGLDPLLASDGQDDLDLDGVVNLEEFNSATNLRNVDTDSDGLTDSQELTLGSSPTNRDSDFDGILDGDEVQFGLDVFVPNDINLDSDGDGFTDSQESLAGTNLSDPNSFPELGQQVWSRKISRAIVVEQGVVLGSSLDNQIVAIAPSGETKWVSDFDSIINSELFQLNANTIIVSFSDSTIRSIDIQTGFDTILYSPDLEDVKVVALGANGDVIVHFDEGTSSSGYASYTLDGLERWIDRDRFNWWEERVAVSSRNTVYLDYYGRIREVDGETGVLVSEFSASISEGVMLGAKGEVIAKNGRGNFDVLTPLGELIWRNGIYDTQTSSDFGMAVSKNESMLVSTSRGLTSYHLNGRRNWSLEEYGNAKSIVADDGTLLLTESDSLVAINGIGEELWRRPNPGSTGDDLILGTEGSIYTVGDLVVKFVGTTREDSVKNSKNIDNQGSNNVCRDGASFLSTSADADGDLIPDCYEYLIGFDLNDSSDALLDSDNDGLINQYEYLNQFAIFNSDSDGDTLLDGDEVNNYFTDPTSADSDSDGISDGEEIANGTDPNVRAENDYFDSDGDGYSDRQENYANTSTSDPASSPEFAQVLWQSEETYSDVSSIIFDQRGDILVADLGGISKLAPGGAELWRREFGANTIHQSEIILGPNNAVLQRKYDTLYSLDSELGDVQWEYFLGNNLPIGVAVDSAGQIYVVTSGSVTALSSSGGVVWSVPGQFDINSILVGKHGNIYFASQRVLHSYTSSGALNWSYEYGVGFKDLWVGSQGNLYLKHDSIYYKEAVSLIDISGNHIHSFTFEENDLGDFFVDEEDNIVFGGVDTYIYNSAGNKIFEGGGNNCYWIRYLKSGGYLCQLNQNIRLLSSDWEEIWTEHESLSSPIVDVDGALVYEENGLIFAAASSVGELGNSFKTSYEYSNNRFNSNNACVIGREYYLPNVDSDEDGISDCVESTSNLDYLNPNDALLDNDGDGLTNLQEIQHNTPLNLSDVDFDSLTDFAEINSAKNVRSKDSDEDGILDADDVSPDFNPVGTDPYFDSDFDGFSDQQESYASTAIFEIASYPASGQELSNFGVPRFSEFALSYENHLLFSRSVFTAVSRSGDLSFVNLPKGSGSDLGLTSTTPALDLNGDAYVASYFSGYYGAAANQYISRIDSDGEIIWQVPFVKYSSTSRILPRGDGLLYLMSSGGDIYTMSALDGTELAQQYESNDTFTGKPAIDSKGNIYTLTTDKTLISFDKELNVRWEITLNIDFSQYGYYYPRVGIKSATEMFVVVGRSIYVINLNGQIIGHSIADEEANDVVIAENGNILVAFDGQLIEYGSDATEISSFASSENERFNALVVLQGGNLLIGSNQRLFELSSNSEVIWENQDAVVPSGGLAIGGDGAIYSVNAGIATIYAGNNVVSLESPWPIRNRDVSRSFNVCVSDRSNYYSPTVDNDADGIMDCDEFLLGLDPVNSSDGGEDSDGDGLTNAEEIQLQTNMLLPDTDGDGWTDAEEVRDFDTDPLSVDTDGDGVNDPLEVLRGTMPNEYNTVKLDSDSDGFSDLVELALGTDFQSENDSPNGVLLYNKFENVSGVPVFDELGNLFLVDDQRLTSYTQAGKYRWSSSFLAISSPVIGPDGQIYLLGQNTSNSDRHLYSVSESGEVLWSKLIDALGNSDGDEVGRISIGSEGNIYLFNQFSASGNVYLQAYASLSGDLAWSTNIGSGNASKIVISANGNVVAQLNDELIILSSLGDVVRRLDFSNAESLNFVVDTNSIYVYGFEQHIIALDNQGTEMWRYFVGDSSTRHMVYNDEFYFSVNNSLVALDKKNGNYSWSIELSTDIESLALSNNVLFLTRSNSTSSVLDDELVLVDATTGQLSVGSVSTSFRYGVLGMGFAPDGSLYVKHQDLDFFSNLSLNPSVRDDWGTANFNVGGNKNICDLNGFNSVAQKDTDLDGVTDCVEHRLGWDYNSSSDGLADSDGDGLTNGEEVNALLDPNSGDSDGDGLQDYDEIYTHQTNPLVADTDGDGLNDGSEVILGSSPTIFNSNLPNLDLDSDGFSNKIESLLNSDLNDSTSQPSSGTQIISANLSVKDFVVAPNGKIIASLRGETQKLAAILPNGETQWVVDMPGSSGRISISGNQIIASTSDGYRSYDLDGNVNWSNGIARTFDAISSTLIVSVQGQSIYANNMEDGSPAWTVTLDSSEGQPGDPIIDEDAGYIYVPRILEDSSVDILIYSFGGDLLQTLDTSVLTYLQSEGYSSVAGNSLIYVNADTNYSVDHTLAAVSLVDGSTHWEYYFGSEANMRSSTPVISESGDLIVCHRNGVTSLNAQTGGFNWMLPIVNECASPAVSADGTIYFGGTERNENNALEFYAINADGTIKWSQEIYQPDVSFEKSKPLVSFDGIVYDAAPRLISFADNNGGTALSSPWSSYRGSIWKTSNISEQITAADDYITFGVRPVVSIEEPSNIFTYNFGEFVQLSASATDAEDGDLTWAVNWLSSIDGVIAEQASIAINDLSVGTHLLTAVVQDSDQNSNTQQVVVTVTPGNLNTLPEIAFENSQYNEGNLWLEYAEIVEVFAIAEDLEDGNISSTIEWRNSSGDLLHTGSSYTFDQANYPPGNYDFVLSVVDSAGGITTRSLRVIFNWRNWPAYPPVIELDTGGGTHYLRTNSTISASAFDPNEGDVTDQIRWRIFNGEEEIYTRYGGGELSIDAINIPGDFEVEVSIDDSTFDTVFASGFIRVIDDLAPEITILSPSIGEDSFILGEDITFRAIASDAEDGDISSQIRWYRASAFIGQGTDVDYSLAYISGNSFYASVVDSFGNETEVGPIYLDVDYPDPYISLRLSGATPVDGHEIILINRDSANFYVWGTSEVDGDGIIYSTEWSSSIDGNFGTDDAMSFSGLSVGEHVISASVTNSLGSSYETSLNVVVRPEDSELPGSFDKHANIGSNESSYSFDVDTGEHSLIGSSLGFSESGDDLNYFYSNTSGDLDLFVRLPALTGNVGAEEHAGLMMRSSLDPLSPFVSIENNHNGYILVAMRADGEEAVQNFEFYNAPAGSSSGNHQNWIGLRKIGNEIVFFSDRSSGSIDGPFRFKEVFRVEAEIPDEYLIGFVQSSGAADASASAIFREIFTTTDIAPYVEIQNSNNSIFELGRSVTLIADSWDVVEGETPVSWSSSVDGVLGTGAQLETNALSEGTHFITATTEDSLGNTYESVITVSVVVPANYTPLITMSSPTSESVFDQGVAIPFNALASDVEDGDISNSIIWESNIDGQMGTGSAISVSSLSLGEHTITASVTDSFGLSDSRSVLITVRDPSADNLPEVVINSPANNSSVETGLNITFTGTATDEEDGNISSAISWYSNLDGLMGTGESITLSSLRVGNHEITASITDSAQQTSTTSIALTITSLVNYPPVIPELPDLTGNVGTPVRLDGRSATDSDGVIVSYEWSSNAFETPLTGSVLNYTFTEVGNVEVTLTVTDNGGKQAQRSFTVSVILDSDNDGVPNSNDLCPNTPAGTFVDSTGCENPNLISSDGTFSSGQQSFQVNLFQGANANFDFSNEFLDIEILNLATQSTPASWNIQLAHAVSITELGEYVFCFDGRAPQGDREVRIIIDEASGDHSYLAYSDVVESLTSEFQSFNSYFNVHTADETARVIVDFGLDEAPAQLDNIGLYRGSVCPPPPVVDTPPSIVINTPADGTSFEWGTTVAFAASAIDTEDGDISSTITWESSLDGSLGLVGASISTSALTPGAHTITASVTDFSQQTSTDAITINISGGPNQPPVIPELPDLNVSLNTEVIFDGSGATDADGSIVSYEWASDAFTSTLTGVAPSYTFTSVGSFDVTLTVTDDDEATDTDTFNVTVSEDNGNWQRTVILIYGRTEQGQDMFFRGGLDSAWSNTNRSTNCTAASGGDHNIPCSIAIRHRNQLHEYTRPWRTGDNYLDWGKLTPERNGREAEQTGTNAVGELAVGTPAVWTTNNCSSGNVYSEEDLPSSCNSSANLYGGGYTAMNTYGDHYWLVDVDMDCNTTINGWFEFKSYISNGPAWENSITQTNFFGLTPPSYQSGNHFAHCGMVNVFERNSNNPVDIKPFTTAN